MTTRIRITQNSWRRLQEALHQEYSRSTVMISWRRRQILGFDISTDILDNWVLVFDNDRTAAMFQLKYSEYLDPGRNPFAHPVYDKIYDTI